MIRPIIVGISGASGAIYGIKLLKALHNFDQPAHAVITESGLQTLRIETDYDIEDIRKLSSEVYSNKDLAASVSSGSFQTRGMVVAPCSIKSLSGIVNSFDSTLLIRAADVTLKERRPLVLMVRETPLHSGHLDLMKRAADLGAIIQPPMPAFYHKPQTIDDIVNQGVGRVLDQFGIEHDLLERWSGS